MKFVVCIFILSFLTSCATERTYEHRSYANACVPVATEDSKETVKETCLPIETHLEEISQWRLYPWEEDQIPSIPDIR